MMEASTGSKGGIGGGGGSSYRGSMWIDGYVGGIGAGGDGHGERQAGMGDGQEGMEDGQAENARFIRHCIRSLAFILYSIDGFI